MRKSKSRFISIISILILVVLTVMSVVPTFATQTNKKVRVGYYISTDMMEGNDETEKSGYGYEYILAVSVYANWEYEYVYGTYDELYEKLVNGEIDILGGVLYDDNRSSSMLFPKYEMGSGNVSLYKKNGTEEIKSVGIFNSDVLENIVRNWANEHNIEISIITYDSNENKIDAFNNGEIDAIVGPENEEDNLNDIQIVDNVERLPYYLVVTNSRGDLLDDLNHALEKLYTRYPNFISNLFYKYYTKSEIESSMCEDEKEWLDTHETLKVGYLENYLPYSDTDSDGNPIGLIVSVIEEILKNISYSSIPTPEYYSYSNVTEMIEGLQNDDIDVVFPISMTLGSLEKNGMMETRTIITSSIYLVYSADLENKENIIVASRNMATERDNLIMNRFENASIIYVNDLGERLEIVGNGLADCATIDGLRLNYGIDLINKYNLHTMLLSSSDNKYLCVKYGNYALLRLLNIGIDELPNGYFIDKVNSSITGETEPQSISFDRIVPYIIVTVAIFLIIIIILLSVLYRRKNQANMRIKRELEIEKILSGEFKDVYVINPIERIVYGISTEYCFMDELRNTYGKRMSFDTMNEKYIETRVHEEDKELVTSLLSIENVSEKLEKEKDYSFVYRVVDFDNKIIFLRAKFSKIPESSEWLLGFELVDRIIREESLASLNEMKNDFLTKISNDIRNPLGVISNLTEVNQNISNDAESNKDRTVKIQNAVEEISTLVNKVALANRLNGELTKVDTYSFNIFTIISESIIELNHLVNKRGIFIDTDFTGITYPFLKGDGDRLASVIKNVLENAIVFNKGNGTVYFSVKVADETDDDVSYEFIIKDTGIGMSEEFIGRIFEPFAREHDDEIFDGIGLGMNIVKKTLDLMNGTINIDSIEGVGTQVSFVIPFKKDMESHIENEDDESSHFNGKMILFASENELISEAIKLNLFIEGANVKCTYDGNSTLEIFEKSDIGYFDIIFIDTHLPSMNGIECARKIRSLDRPDSNIPIVGMTSSTVNDAAECNEAGMNKCILKPVNAHLIKSLTNRYT